MKTFISILVILVFIVGVTFGVKNVIAANKAAEEKRLIGWALHHEKTDRYSDVVAKAIDTLETRLDAIEKRSGIKPSSLFLEDDETPSVLRYRLKCTPLPFMGEKRYYQLMLMEIGVVLERAVRFDHLIRAYPSAQQRDLFKHYDLAREGRSKESEEINMSVNVDLLAILNAQNEEMEQIDSLRAADVSEQRIASQRELESRR